MASRRRSRFTDEREKRERKDGITRRDFLDGTAVTAAGLAMAAAAPGLTGAEAMAAAQQPSTALPTDYYPPGFATPNTGQPDAVIDRTFKLDGPPPTSPSQIHPTDGGPGINKAAHDTGERYDCVIVGAGASGISAAKSHLDRFGSDKRILILDALPDFGGHSHRNEFHIPNAADANGDVMILRNGGTVNLDSIGTCCSRPPGSAEATTWSPRATPGRSPARSPARSRAGPRSSRARRTRALRASRSCASRPPTRTSSPTRRAPRSPRPRSATT